MINRIDYIRLYRANGIGPAIFEKLINKYGNPSNAIKNISNKYKIPTEDEVKKEIEKVYELGGEIIIKADDLYPESLKSSTHAPNVLTTLGDLNLLKKTIISVVGSRNASLTSMSWTKNFCRELSKEGYVIASGLAMGVDSAAHTSSLEGGTIAIIGGGINTIYPSKNASLYEKIKQKGLLISEFKYNDEPQQSHFTIRNKTIASISEAVVVAEAAQKSGSLLTAEFAIQNNIDVFAVPNHPYDFRSKGTNFLLKQGAYLIENASDFLEIFESEGSKFSKKINKEIKHYKKNNQKSLFSESNPSNLIEQDYKEDSYECSTIKEKILKCLSKTSSNNVEEISNQLKIPVEKINIEVTRLKIQKKVRVTIDGEILLY